MLKFKSQEFKNKIKIIPITIDENLRITQAKWDQLDRERQAKLDEAKKAEEAKELERKAELDKKQGEEKIAEFNRQISEDLNDLYDGKLLPRPEKIEEINNTETKDEAAKETQKLLKFGVDLNTQRVKDGKPPVTSLAKIYFLHYKPTLGEKTEQPPGADAPVAGATSAPQEATSDKITPQKMAQLRKESWYQTAHRVLKEMGKR